MRRLLCWHVVSDATAQRFAWGAAFLLLTACTALLLKVLPEFEWLASTGLVFAVALGWTVLGFIMLWDGVIRVAGRF
jgi:hypothetical protein